MKIDKQRRYKEVLKEQILPTLTDPKITDNDMISMYNMTKLEEVPKTAKSSNLSEWINLGPKIYSMDLTGRPAIQKAIEEGLSLYYNTPKWYILSRIDSPMRKLRISGPCITGE